MHTLHRINIARFGLICGNDFVKYALIKLSSTYNKKEIEIWYRLIVNFRGTRNTALLVILICMIL